MKVLKVSEVTSGIDTIIQNKEKEKEQILKLRDEMNNVIDLDGALEGEGGVAIREHFATLHFPAIILFNLFLEEYVNILEKIKSSVQSFENDNGFVRTDFIENDVENGLNKLENLTNDIVNDINSHYSRVSDLVSSGRVSSYYFNLHIADAKRQNNDTVSELEELDESSNSNLEASVDSVDDITQFITKIQSWTKNGVFLTEDQINEVEDYFMESDTIKKMIEDATKLSIDQGGSTSLGNIASWLDTIGKGKGVYDIVKGAIAFTILKTNMLDLVEDGKGNFVVRASSKWKKVDGKYESKLASNVYRLLQSGDKNSKNLLKQYLGKFNEKPAGLLKKIIGLKPGTGKISFGKIANSYSNVLVLDKDMLKDYKWKVDVKATTKQFTDVKGVTKFAKRIPYVGILFSVGTNYGEFFSDENKHKSAFEKSGRFAAGLGVDLGVSALTTGGAAIGTIFCPGIGTIIGGAVGAGIGIVGSLVYGDAIKDWGENAGKWVEDRYEDAKEMASDAMDWVEEGVNDIVSDAGDFISGIFN